MVGMSLTLYRLFRLVLKYTNPVLIAVCLFAGFFAYGLHLKNNSLSQKNEQLAHVNKQLTHQIINEKKAWLAHERQATKYRLNASRRQQRLHLAIAQPTIGDSANDRVAPVIVHALAELREHHP